MMRTCSVDEEIVRDKEEEDTVIADPVCLG